MERNYISINSKNSNPFVFSLTGRGFYSEINNLLNAILYGLVTKRRLIIDQSRFAGGDLVWSDLYSSSLPLAAEDLLQNIHPDWTITGHDSPGFRHIQHSINRWHRYRRFFLSKSYGFHISVFAAQRYLASQLCQPSVFIERRNSFNEPYAAIHVRRGDKVDGYKSSKGYQIIEGENIPLCDYLSVIRNKLPVLKRLFVMADDYGVINELRSMVSDLEIVTLCQDTEQGYKQNDFALLDKSTKILSIRRLISEVDIASNSQVFVGCYKSNVSRYIALTHRKPNRCFSIDSQKHWSSL